MSNKKNTTVFAEGKAIMTTSPYEKYYDTNGNELDLPHDEIEKMPEEERVKLRLECVKLAIVTLESTDTTEVLPYAKKIWKFVTKEE